MRWNLVNTARRAWALWLLLPAAAVTVNLQFMGQAPVAFANAEDDAIFKRHLDAVLAGGEPGRPWDWENPNTGTRGTITLLERFKRDSRPCGRVNIHNEAGGRTGGGVFTSCRLDTGEWQLVVLPES